MGIERFFNSIIQNKTIKNKEGDFVLQQKIKIDYMYIDFNSILYKVASEIEEELNHILYDIVYLEDIKTLSNKSIDIAKIWNYQPEDNTIGEFKKYFTEELIDKMSITKVKHHLDNMIDNIIDGKNIKKIIVSMDGIPNMAKIAEQKKRRYNMYIINKLKKELYKDHKDKMDEKRKLFEENRYGYNRNKILAWNSFMKKVTEELTSDGYINHIRNKYPDIEEYIFSGSDVPGEGEKKIMELILNNNQDGKYIIYSPDSDVIILSIILANKKQKSEIFMMHYEQNRKEFTIIDINKLIDNIYQYVKTRVKTSLKEKINKNSITNDIAVLFSMFGNDFIPKIESLDVRKDFMIIINKYCEILDLSKETNLYYITYTINENTRINYQSLKNFMKKMAEVEFYLIKDTYMANNYNNYKSLKEKLKVNNLYIWLINYVNKINKVLDEIYNWEKILNDNLKISTSIEELQNILIKGLYKKLEKEFIRDFILIETKQTEEITDETKIEDIFINKIKSYFVIEQKENKHYKLNINLKLRLRPYDDDLESKFHKENLEKLKVTDNMKITEYDKEYYLMERMMGRFRKNLNATNNEVGKTTLSVIRKVNKKYYKIVTNKHIDGETKDYLDYYSIYFNEKPNSLKIEKYCEEYLSGLFWVTDFYFNKNNPVENRDFVSTWFYMSHRPPLIREISNYLQKEKYSEITEFSKNMKKINNDTMIKIVKREDFFTPKEHYYYITPINSLPLNSLDNIKDIYPDLDSIVNKIYRPEINKEKIPIDCSTATFISKCNLDIEPITYEAFYKFIKNYREKTNSQIDIMPYSYKFKNHEELTQSEESKITNAINNMSPKLLKEFKAQFKKKYLQTRNHNHKLIYKTAKKHLSLIKVY